VTKHILLTQCSRAIPLLLVPVLLLPAAGAQRTLQVTVVDGDGAFNDIRRSQARAPVVEVRDEDNRVVPDARVVFQLPDMGAGGTFTDGSRTLVATTDATGRATGTGLRPNRIEGAFTITVTASKDGAMGRVEVRQSNTLAGGDQAMQSNGHGKAKILIAVAGAAGGIAIAALRAGGKSSTSASSTNSAPVTSLSAGAVTIGGPR
jgi:hypothetical protein